MRKLRVLLFLAALGGHLADSEAARPKRWLVSSAQDFLAGDFKDAYVSSDGRLLLAPTLEEVLDTEQPVIHAAVADKSGNLFVATGNDGKIFRIPRRGSGEQWADLEENGVIALAVDSQNRLYAGTSPGGKVYRIAGQNQAEAFFEADDKFLWDMLFDERDQLYVATGPRGRVVRVDAGGNGQVFYDSSEQHVISLARDLDGNLIAGTAPGGQLIRISAAGKGFVLYDSEMEEVRGLEVDRYGNLYAAALSFANGKPAAAAAAAATVTVTARAPAKTEQKNGAPDEEQTIRLAGDRKGKRLEVFRVDREGLVETLYGADDALAFDLLVWDDGSLLVGTSDKGRVLAVSPQRLVRLVAQTPDDQATVLVNVEGTLYVASSNLGKVYRLGPSAAAKGTYESRSFDAGMLARWGKLRWNVDDPQPTPPKWRTRSGNTKKPDGTWSEWSDPLEDSGGSQISSPEARYLQVQVEFSRPSGDSSLLSTANGVRWFEVHYLQRNLAPRVDELTVLPPGTALMKLPAAANPASVALGGPDDAHLYVLPEVVRSLGQPTITPPPQKVFVPGARSLTWKAQDANDDDLVYTLHYRRVDERGWKPLASDWKDTFYTIDGASLPSGMYEVKVVASDHLSNPPEMAQKGELVSPPFVLANAAPRLETSAPQVSGNRAEVRFVASSEATAIYQAEYSLDGKAWTVLFPEDGIADSSRESFRLTLQDLAPGEHVLALRAVDAAGNLGTGRVVFEVE